MESSLIFLYVGALGVTFFIVTILYFLYKCLMRETPYQRTFLIDEVDSKHKENDKKLIKKSKNNVRQRVISKAIEPVDKVASKEIVAVAEKSALNASPIIEVKLPQVQSEAAQGAWNGLEKVEVKKRSTVGIEKVVQCKKSVVEVTERTGRPLVAGKDEKFKQAKLPESVDMEQKEDKKVQKKQTKEVIASKPGKEQVDSEFNQQVDKKKRNKRSNEESRSLESKRPELAQGNKPVVEEMLVEQKVVSTSAAPQQQPTIKKKAKTLEEYEEDESVPFELKQKKASGHVDLSQQQQEQQIASNISRQQQKQLNKMTNDLQDLKRLIVDKDVIIQRDQQQIKSLNEALLQMKKELTTERAQQSEVKNGLHNTNKKLSEENQALLNSLHQKEAQSKQAIALLQQELQGAKTRPNELTIIMSNLAEENAKLKTELSHAEKQLNMEMNEKVKAVELLNEAMRKLDHTEMMNQSLELKVKQAEDRSRSIEAKQQETIDSKTHLEKSYYDLQQEYQLVKKQSQPIAELQNQLVTAKLENDELQALIGQLRKQALDLENELVIVKEKSIVSESMQQSEAHHDDQIMNGCNDTGVIAHMESLIAEQEKDKKELSEKLEVVDKKNMILESERVELMVALEKLKKQVVDLEKELENTKLPPLPLEPVVSEQQVIEVSNQVANGCGDSEFIMKLEATLTEKEEDCKALRDALEVKDKKNEDLRQKNWKAMKALEEAENRAESIRSDYESQVTELVGEVGDLKAKLYEAENRPVEVEIVSVQQTETLGGAKAGSNEEGDKEPVVENVKEFKMTAKFNEIYIEKQEDEIRTLREELQEQKNKNDKLRENNWTMMTTLDEAENKIENLRDRLAKTECQLQEFIKSSSSLSSPDNQSSPSKSLNGEEIVRKVVTVVNEVKETCQWDMSQLVLDLDTKTAELEILQSLLDQHENSIIDLQAENNELRNKACQSNGEGESKVLLEQKVEHYKNVLSDTESILRTLEASVNAEENKWRSKMEKLEGELVLLRQKTE